MQDEDYGEKKDRKIGIFAILTVILLIFTLSTISYADYMGLPLTWRIAYGDLETLGVSDTDTDYTTLICRLHTLNTPNMTIWFEYGMVPGAYLYKSSNITVNSTGDYSAVVSGVQLLADQKYYFTAYGQTTTEVLDGGELNFTLGSLTPLTEYNFSHNYQTLVESEFDPAALASVLPMTYTDIIGIGFWGIVFGMLFIVMWIRGEDVALPALLGMIIGGIIWQFMSPEFVRIAYILFIVSFAGMVYTLIIGRYR